MVIFANLATQLKEDNFNFSKKASQIVETINANIKNYQKRKLWDGRVYNDSKSTEMKLLRNLFTSVHQKQNVALKNSSYY